LSGKKDGGIYGDFVKELDDSVGQVLAAVEAAGLRDNTLIVFMSDNGPARFGSAGPLSGGKYVTMEGGHRVPAIFYWPGTIPAGQVSDARVSSLDLLPLFCCAAGVALPADRTLDGFNMMDLLTGKTDQSPREYFYYYNGVNLQAVRKGPWKLHLPRTADDQPYWAKKGSAPRKPYVSLNEPLLFDLDSDVGEQENVIAHHPEVAAELMKEAERVRAELGDVAVTGSDQRPHGLPHPQDKGEETGATKPAGAAVAAPVVDSVASRPGPIRVACVGDSITSGFGLKNPQTDSYPARLQTLLGEKYAVENFGKNGATVLKKGHAPYWKAPQYKAALQFNPDQVVILLGTNDTRPENVGQHKAEFVPDYLELIRSFQALESKPSLWICYASPIYLPRKGMTDAVLQNEIIPLIAEVSRQAGINAIDLNTVLSHQPELFSDGLHPNPAGAGVIAETVAAAIMPSDH
jgi:lysophospholipase L1-like esterase